MKNNRKILTTVIILIILCLLLSGCSKASANSQDQEVSVIQNISPTEYITTAPAIKAPESETPDSNKPDKESVNEPAPTPQLAGSEFEFKETKETVYALVNVKIRSSCETDIDNIITILQKGDYVQRIGSNEEWSKVLYERQICYIKSEYLSTVKPAADESPGKPSLTAAPAVKEESAGTKSAIFTGAPADTQKDTVSETDSNKDFVSELNISQDISQLVLVIGSGGSDCTVSYHSKDAAGNWSEIFTTDGNCGTKGITYHKKEGDSKTPAGYYSFTTAFGIKKDPGAKLTYRQVTDYDYWVDDVSSPFYNTWVNILDTPGDFTSEHLIDHNPQYNYAFNINYNPECTPGLGSAIFLHCFNGSGRTSGCIAISEKYVKTLVQELDGNARILILPDRDELKNY